MEELGLHHTTTITLKRGRHGPSYLVDVKALNLHGDLSPAVRAITSGPDNFRAMELAAKLGGKGYGAALYLIGPEEGGVIKVGYAADPKWRLTTLQIGNWHQLHVLGLLWVDRAPGLVEGRVHRAAKEMNWMLRGEWLSATTEEAAELVLKAARHSKLNCYDSAVWIDNWSSKLAALADHNGSTSRIAA